MANMLPHTISEDTISEAEMRLFDKFKSEASDKYYILHSFNIAGNPWKEIDFLVLSPKGIFVLEVKGGYVDFIDGYWVYTNKKYKSSRSTTNPWRQADGNRYALREAFQKRFRGKKLPVLGYGVVFPDNERVPSTIEVNEDVALLKRGFKEPIGRYLKHLERYWLHDYCKTHQECPEYSHKKECKNFGKLDQCPLKLDMAEMEKMLSLLRPTSKVTKSLKSELNNLEKRLIELTDEQVDSLKLIDDNPRTIIEGGTGTGKTIIALKKAIEKAKDGKKVLLLCFNEMLADYLLENTPKELIKDDNFKVCSFHGYVRKRIESGEDFEYINSDEFSDEERYNYVYPTYFCELTEKSQDEERFDMVFVDEAQDLMNMEFMKAISVMVKGGLENGSWHMFTDPNQNIFGRKSEETREFLDGFRPAVKKLTVNCRNCRKVAESVTEISGYQIPLESAVRGGRSKTSLYKGQRDFLKQFEKEVQKLLDQGIDPNDMVILSTHKLENSLLNGHAEIAGHPIVDIRHSEPVENSLHFCTMHSFKGLERNVVLAVDVDSTDSEYYKRLLYSGLSRAKTYVHVFKEVD